MSRLNGTDAASVLDSAYCQVPRPGAAPVRRLTNIEYQYTLTDIIGDRAFVEVASKDLPGEPESLGFRRSATGLNVSSLLADRYRSIATEVARAFGTSCDGLGEEPCAERFVRQLGLRLYRRPLEDHEADAYLNLFRLSRAEDTFERALQWMVTAMLQSPYFLYRIEQPDAEQPDAEQPDAEGAAALTGYALASRLSYLLWQSLPDTALFAAAATGQLESSEQVAAQVERMLQNPKAERSYEFFAQWLDLDRLQSQSRDPERYPEASPALFELFQTESRDFVQDLLNQGGTFAELFSAEHTFANQELARHYGLIGPADSAFERVSAPGRYGILTQGMLLAHDSTTRTSIVRRGLKIRTDLLCQTVPAPPDSVDLSLPEVSLELSQRQRLEQHRNNPSCNVCHALMDPIGVVFEAFDALGRSRDVDEGGNPVDTHGALAGTRELDGEVDGVGELAARLAVSREAEECYMLQNFRFFYGRDPEAEDLCSQAQLFSHFAASDFSLKDMLVALTETDAFRYLAPMAELEPTLNASTAENLP